MEILDLLMYFFAGGVIGFIIMSLFITDKETYRPKNRSRD